MKRKRSLRLLGSACLVLALAAALLLAACAKEVPAPAPTAPAPVSTVPAPVPAVPASTPTVPTPAWVPERTITAVGGGPVTSGYITALGLFSGLSKATGVKFTCEPYAKSPARYAVFFKEHLDFVGSPLSSNWCIYSGDPSFPYGPQRVSLVWNGLPLSYGLYTQGDSDVKTIEDIKGKRVCSFPTTASAHDDMTAMLAYVGLTWDDVTPVPCSGYPDAAHAIIEGRADVAHYTTTAGETYDVAGSPRGIHWIETPASDKEGWARVAETRPFITPALAVRGAGLKEGETFEGYGKPLGLVTGDWTDENLAYWTTKTIAENYDAYKANHEMLLYWTLDQALDVGAFIIPYHSGSIRYFKEIGRWSPELEQLQSKLVAVGEKAIQDYEQANPGWETGRAPLIFEEGKWK